MVKKVVKVVMHQLILQTNLLLIKISETTKTNFTKLQIDGIQNHTTWTSTLKNLKQKM